MTEIQPTYPENSTSRRVIDYASQQFFAKGLRQVTMDDIAKGLQMSKRTLYQLFADKEQLIIACFTVYAEQERALTERLREQHLNVLEIVLHILEQRLKVMQQVRRPFFTDLMRYESVVAYVNAVQKESIDRAVAFLSQGVEQGLFLSNVNFALIMHSLLKRADSLVPEDIFTNISIEEYFINIGLFHLRGCCTAAGIALVDDFFKKYITTH